MFLPAEVTDPIVEEWITEGNELRGPNGHRQRDWLTKTPFSWVPGWNFYPCVDKELNLDSVVDALNHVLPTGKTTQKGKDGFHRVNVGLMAPQGPNQCFVWKQDEPYTSVSGKNNMGS